MLFKETIPELDAVRFVEVLHQERCYHVEHPAKLVVDNFKLRKHLLLLRGKVGRHVCWRWRGLRRGGLGKDGGSVHCDWRARGGLLALPCDDCGGDCPADVEKLRTHLHCDAGPIRSGRGAAPSAE